jgi:hypothetical protein
MRANKM